MSNAGLIFHIKTHHKNEKNEEILDKHTKNVKHQDKKEINKEVVKKQAKRSSERAKTFKQIETIISNNSKGQKTKIEKLKPKIENRKTNVKKNDQKNSSKQKASTSRTRKSKQK